MTRKSFLSQGIAALVFLTARMRGQDSPQQPSAADQKSIDQDVDLMRKDLRSQKKQIVAAVSVPIAPMIPALTASPGRRRAGGSPGTPQDIASFTSTG